MTAPYDHAALFLKAKLFLNRAMDPEAPRPFEEQALWASLALELLAKAALARVSPLLIAEPTEEGTNLLIASGLIEGNARFTTVRAKTLYSRCSKAFRPFSEAEAGQITNARNEYLHGSTVGFTNIPEDAWWPRYWAQAAILVHALDREPSDLVGSDRESVVSDHLERNTKNLEHRVTMLTERAKQRLAQHQAGTLPAKVAKDWFPGLDYSAGLGHADTAECPACHNVGHLEGEFVLDTDIDYGTPSDPEGFWDASITLTIGAEYFSCTYCGLVLDTYELIEAADLPTSFDVEGSLADIGYFEGEYGND